MDSATQFLLGASISGAMLGSRIGAKSLLIGGIVATLPDLDTFIPMKNAIDNMTYHRGFSHSVVVQSFAAPLFAFVISRVVKSTRDMPGLLTLTIWLALVTHSLLDSLTTYGTQLFWPLSNGPPIAYPSVFIIDPLYSLLLLIGILSFAIFKWVRFNRLLLGLSTLYLCVGITGHMVVEARAKAHPAYENMEIHVQPTPFNILAWQALGIHETGYVSGITAIGPSCSITNIKKRERNSAPPAGYTRDPSVKRFEWFTNGFYSYGETEDALTITDLRIGFHPVYVFLFRIADKNEQGFHSIAPVRMRPGKSLRERVFEILGQIPDMLEQCG